MKETVFSAIISLLLTTPAHAEGGSGGGGSPCPEYRPVQCLKAAEEHFEKNMKFPGYKVEGFRVYDLSSCGGVRPVGQDENIFTFKLVSTSNPSLVEYYGVSVFTTNDRPCKIFSSRIFKR